MRYLMASFLAHCGLKMVPQAGLRPYGYGVAETLSRAFSDWTVGGHNLGGITSVVSPRTTGSASTGSTPTKHVKQALGCSYQATHVARSQFLE